MALIVPAARLNDARFDARQNDLFPVARSRKYLVEVADLVKTATISCDEHGKVATLITSAPNIPTDTTFDVKFVDQDGITIHDETGIADTIKVRTDLTGSQVLVSGAFTIIVDFATDLSGDTLEFDIVLEMMEPEL